MQFSSVQQPHLCCTNIQEDGQSRTTRQSALYSNPTCAEGDCLAPVIYRGKCWGASVQAGHPICQFNFGRKQPLWDSPGSAVVAAEACTFVQKGIFLRHALLQI